MPKVWNISDHPRSETRPSAIHMFGKRVGPGKSVEIDKSRLFAAEDMQAKSPELVHVGDTLPLYYLKAKGLVKSEAPHGTSPNHSPVTGVVKKEAAKEAPKATYKPDLKKAEVKEEPKEAPKATKSEDTAESKGKKSRGK